MKFEMSKEVPDSIIKRGRNRGNVSQKVLEFLDSDSNCLTIECENKKEARSVYNIIYAMSKRRRYLPISRYMSGNKIFVTKIKDKEEKQCQNQQEQS